jgi:protein gp37
VMARADWHIFQVLTKRSPRLAKLGPSLPWAPHIWAGVSVETSQYHWRVDHLRQVPASVRFISAEPLLSSLNAVDLTGIHWLIAGGESGHGHRPCDPNWICELRDRCQAAQIAFFFKQWGGRTPKAGGRELDGQTWDEMPTVPGVRQHELFETIDKRNRNSSARLTAARAFLFTCFPVVLHAYLYQIGMSQG